MTSIKWLTQNEHTRSLEFYEALKLALSEREDDPRLKSRMTWERKNAVMALTEVRAMADRAPSKARG